MEETEMKHLRELIRNGFNYEALDMNKIGSTLGKYMEYTIPDFVFDWTVGDLKEARANDFYVAAKLEEPVMVVEFCNFIYCMARDCSKEYMKQVHKQLNAVYEKGEYDIFDFYGAYFRYYYLLKQNGMDVNTLIPDDVIASDEPIEAMFDFHVKESYLVEEPKYGDTVEYIASVIKELEASFEYDGRKYQAVVPHTYREIVTESTAMHNCLASRVCEYVKDKWVYVFIRSMDEPQNPYIDVCINTGMYGEPAGPQWVVLKDHVDVAGTSAEGIYLTWLTMASHKLHLVYDEVKRMGSYKNSLVWRAA